MAARADSLGGQQGEGGEVESDVDDEQPGQDGDPDRVIVRAAGGIGGDEGIDEGRGPDGDQAGQAAAEPGEEAGALDLRDVPYGGHRLLPRLGDALRTVN